MFSMKIGLDFDDVTNDFVSNLMEFYHKKYGKKVEKKDLLVFDWSLYWGIPRDEATRRVDEFHESHKVEELPPVKDAISSLNKLMKRNELVIITGRPLRFKSTVENWLKHHLKKNLQVIHAGEYHKGQAARKSKICKELGISLMIEDSGETALDCAEEGIKVLLFDKPWNKNFKHKNVIRVKGWKEALVEINLLK